MVSLIVDLIMGDPKFRSKMSSDQRFPRYRVFKYPIDAKMHTFDKTNSKNPAVCVAVLTAHVDCTAFALNRTEYALRLH